MLSLLRLSARILAERRTFERLRLLRRRLGPGLDPHGSDSRSEATRSLTGPGGPSTTMATHFAAFRAYPVAARQRRMTHYTTGKSCGKRRRTQAN